MKNKRKKRPDNSAALSVGVQLNYARISTLPPRLHDYQQEYCILTTCDINFFLTLLNYYHYYLKNINNKCMKFRLHTV